MKNIKIFIFLMDEIETNGHNSSLLTVKDTYIHIEAKRHLNERKWESKYENDRKRQMCCFTSSEKTWWLIIISLNVFSHATEDGRNMPRKWKRGSNKGQISLAEKYPWPISLCSWLRLQRLCSWFDVVDFFASRGAHENADGSGRISEVS